jgi:hypothetical protein
MWIVLELDLLEIIIQFGVFWALFNP